MTNKIPTKVDSKVHLMSSFYYTMQPIFSNKKSPFLALSGDKDYLVVLLTLK